MFEKKSNKHFLTGMFFLIGVFLVITFIFAIGDKQGIIEPKFKVQVLFRDVQGLAEKAPVRLSGVLVGIVSDIRFLPEEYQGKRVQVTLDILRKYKRQLNKAAMFSIQTDGILGEKLLVINVIDSAEAMDLSKPVMGEDPIDVQDLAVVFADAAESFTKTSNELSKIDAQKISNGIDRISGSLVETSGEFGEALRELQYLTKKTKRLLNRVEQKIIDGTLFKVF